MDIAFDSILLFTLVIPYIMGYRISPFETQYWLFGLIFLGLIVYILIDIFLKKSNIFNVYKNIFLWVVILLVLGSSFSAAISNRHKTHPIYQIHDIILQQEAAIQYLIHGKNPYATTYFGTFMEQWPYSTTEVNPALYHFVMEPFYLIFSLPFYSVSNHTIGYFDGRIPLYILFFSILIMAFFLVEDQEKRRLFVILLAFHPAMLPYTLEGRSDYFMYAFLFAALYLLYKNKFTIAAVPMGLAFAIKQSAWPIFPLYIAYLYFKTKNIKLIIRNVLVFAIFFGLIVIPFYLWNPKAFIDSTIGFLNGSVEHSYPISGYGLGSVLLESHVVKDKFAYYPFIIWQLLAAVPALVLSIYYLKKHISIRSLIITYGIFLFVFWYCSRYFNNSHLAYISVVLLTGYFWPEEHKEKIDDKEYERKKHSHKK